MLSIHASRPYIYVYIQAPCLQGSRSIGKMLTLFCATDFSISPQSKGHNSHSKHWACFPCANCSSSLGRGVSFWSWWQGQSIIVCQHVSGVQGGSYLRSTDHTHARTKLFNQSLTVQSTQSFHSAEKDDTPLHWHIILWWMQNLSPYHFSLRTSAYHRPF